jgi:hypothetical protein
MKGKEIARALECRCCGADVDPAEQVEHPALPFCSRCVSERCPKCRRLVRVIKWRRDPTFNLIGRPRGPRMKCGWGCGSGLTEHQMRRHFTCCSRRPAIPNHDGRIQCEPMKGAKAKRGRPPGPRMLCGWGCGLQLTATQIRGHFAECPNRPTG